MVPIQELLNRIRWDAEFGRGEFAVGYYDRVEDRIIAVPFSKIRLTPGERFAFHVSGPDGEEISIPFHRVRQVYKNGELIWSR